MSDTAVVLYKDSRSCVTYSTLENEGMSYPVSKIDSVYKPVELTYKSFGGRLQGVGIIALAFMAILAFGVQWGILGVALLLIMGLFFVTGIFDFWRQFGRVWFVTVTLVDGEEFRIHRLKKKQIEGIYMGIRKALEE
jgi:hypothetical protein